jgi:hypothetical protein
MEVEIYYNKFGVVITDEILNKSSSILVLRNISKAQIISIKLRNNNAGYLMMFSIFIATFPLYSYNTFQYTGESLTYIWGMAFILLLISIYLFNNGGYSYGVELTMNSGNKELLMTDSIYESEKLLTAISNVVSKKQPEFSN